MRWKLLLPAAAGLLVSGAILTAEPDTPRLPQSANAQVAKSRHDEVVNKARREFEAATLAARKAYLEELDKCLKDATKAGQLDEAVRIRDLKASVEASREATPAKAREGAVTFRGVQYRIFLADVRWGEAREQCRRLGGDLASVDSKEKREFLAKQTGSLQLWVGAVHDEKARRWHWANGGGIAADAWSPGRPQNLGPCAVLFGKTGLLGDAKDQLPDCKGFICEWRR